jgi:hypothetical protein
MPNSEYIAENIYPILIEKLIRPNFVAFRKVCELYNVWNIVKQTLLNDINYHRYTYLMDLECMQDILNIIKQ